MLNYQKSKIKALSMGKKDELTKPLTAISIKTKNFKFNREESNCRAMRL